ncbi:MAG: branched-chain amino acid ABC transporter permease [Thermodesulfobacteriota bacterium]|nr:branched-chain amino acid ABC transporter permease [Thermodesulfobacteriota bacterium]
MTGLLIYGFINSMTLMLIALGFSLAFGIAGIANFAYGAFYVLAGFIVVSLLNTLGLPYPLVIIFCLILMAGIGILMYWTVLLRIRGASLSEIIATFGLGVVILECLRGRGLIGFYNIPPFIKGGFEIAGVGLDYQRLFIIGIALAVLLFLWFFSHYNKIGLGFRAVAQNEQTALCCGMNSDRLAMFSMAFSSALAAVAAFTILPLGTLMIDAGYDILIIAVGVGIVGGLGSNTGIILASLVLGYAQQIVATYLGSHWMMLVVFAAMLLILLIKPSGLFGKLKELEERI